jgi:hypothetical protein
MLRLGQRTIRRNNTLDQDYVSLDASGTANASYGQNATPERRAELVMVAALAEKGSKDRQSGFTAAAKNSVVPTVAERAQAAIIGRQFQDTKAGEIRAREQAILGTMHYVTGGRQGTENDVTRHLVGKYGQYGDGTEFRGNNVQSDLQKYGFLTGPAFYAGDKHPLIDNIGPVIASRMRMATGKYIEGQMEQRGFAPGSYGMDEAVAFARTIPVEIPWASYVAAKQHGDEICKTDPQFIHAIARTGLSLGGKPHDYEEAYAAIRFQRSQGAGSWNESAERIRELRNAGYRNRDLTDPRVAQAANTLQRQGQPITKEAMDLLVKGQRKSRADNDQRTRSGRESRPEFTPPNPPIPQAPHTPPAAAQAPTIEPPPAAPFNPL